jgi:nickel-dependent lactate racemase
LGKCGWSHVSSYVTESMSQSTKGLMRGRAFSQLPCFEEVVYGDGRKEMRKDRELKKLYIICKGNPVPFELPSGWRLLSFAAFPEHGYVQDPRALTRDSLRNPIGSPTLANSLSPRNRVAILVEDVTRASPKGLILEALTEELREIGIPESRISIVIALGTHRPLTEGELQGIFGRDLLSRFAFFNHDCHATDLVPVGELETGRRVRINRTVWEADFRIGIGSIFPHPMNGFGGGAKILFPGVADFDSILEHHLLFTFHPGTALGKMEGNLFHEQVCAVARSAGLHFVINSVMNQNDEVSGIVCGDPIDAHKAGVERCKSLISWKFEKKADVSLITSFPYTEGPQIVKPLAPASMVTRDGGTIILAADCSGNLPDPFIEAFHAFHSSFKGRLMEGVLHHFNNKELIMKGGAIDFNMALGMTLAAQDRFQIILVTQDIPGRKAEMMGFVHAHALQEAFERVSSFLPEPTVHVIPSGGVILPMLGSDFDG